MRGRTGCACHRRNALDTAPAAARLYPPIRTLWPAAEVPPTSVRRPARSLTRLRRRVSTRRGHLRLTHASTRAMQSTPRRARSNRKPTSTDGGYQSGAATADAQARPATPRRRPQRIYVPSLDGIGRPIKSRLFRTPSLPRMWAACVRTVSTPSCRAWAIRHGSGPC
jgi:hypothetical protein